MADNNKKERDQRQNQDPKKEQKAGNNKQSGNGGMNKRDMDKDTTRREGKDERKR